MTAAPFLSGSRPWARAVASLVLFVPAFFAAYRFGMSFSQAIPAPLWFPDTVLLCALLLTPPRTWWLYLLAAAPIRFLFFTGGMPAWFLIAAFLNDSVKALLSATILRQVLPDPIRYDRVRDLARYVLVAVLAVPMLSAVAGAAAGSALGREFWPSLRQWFLGNAMANLLLTPAVLYWFFGARGRRLKASRLVEALLLAGGFAALGLLAFGGAFEAPFDSLLLLYGPLPFLLWAALRFGLRGVSAALTLSLFFAAGAAARGLGPFAQHSPEESVLWIQLFLFVVSLPVLFLAALGAERDEILLALRESETRYRDVVDSQADLVCRYLPDATLTFVNEACCRFFGRSRDQLVGRKITELVPAEVLEHHKPRRGESSSPGNEHEVVRPDGVAVWQQWIDHPVFDSEGRLTEFQAIGHDITDRKRAEEADRQLALAGRLALLGELTASIAHEINQPLGAILSNADAAEMLLEAGDGRIHEVRAILEEIRHEDLRASGVIRQIGSLVRSRRMELQPIDLRVIADDVLHLAEVEARRRGISIGVEFDPSLPSVQGDRVWLQQVLLNLMLNAMEAMDQTPRGDRVLRIHARPDGRDCVEVAVTDSGHGIAPQLLPNVFKSFVTSRENGMGLGLSISRSIVEAHGGKIHAENNPGGGATVRFTLRTEIASA